MIDCMDIHSKMTSSSITLEYRGELTFDLVDSMLGIMLEKLEANEPNVKIRKNVFSILVECLQNLCHHTNYPEEFESENKINLKAAAIEVQKQGEHYVIQTGNYIHRHKVDILKNWIEMINSYSRTELKTLYNSILTNKDFNDKGGAGLGFIDMARKSSEKIKFDFIEINNKYAFFTLSITI